MDNEFSRYYLYGAGYPVERLCLGHLCFGSLTYSEPTLDEAWYHCADPMTYEPLGEGGQM